MLGSLLPTMICINIYSRIEKKLVKLAQDRKAESSVVAEECFSNSRTVKAFAMEEKEIAKYDRMNLLVYLVGIKRAIYYGGFSFVFTTFMYGAMVVVIWYGTFLNSNNDITVGSITSYLFYCIQILVNFAIF